ncbi:hypothetical protein PGB90_003530 [Kerria lacca]
MWKKFTFVISPKYVKNCVKLTIDSVILAIRLINVSCERSLPEKKFLRFGEIINSFLSTERNIERNTF